MGVIAQRERTLFIQFQSSLFAVLVKAFCFALVADFARLGFLHSGLVV